jgi:two-component sensor histidine kinase
MSTSEFEARAQRSVSEYQRYIDSQMLALTGLSALVGHDPEADVDAWRRYLRTTDPYSALETTQGVGLAKRYDTRRPDEIRPYLARYGLSKSAWPTSGLPNGFAITILEPANERNLAALGYDMFTEERRRAAMQQAMRTGQPTSTAPVTLKQEISGPVQSGFLVYVPVREPGTNNAIGFVYAPYRVGDFFRSVLQSLPSKQFAARVLTPEGEEIYRDGVAKARSPYSADLRIADRVYRLEINSTKPALSGLTLYVLLLGLLLAATLTWLAVVQSKRLEVTRQLADERQASDEHSKLLMGELSHRIKNAFARISAIAYLTGKEVKTTNEFLERFNERLNALARSKDALLGDIERSGRFSEIYTDEMAVAGRAVDKDSLDGDLELSSTEYATITLCIHELITNSIKYGALGKGGKISCSAADRGGKRSISWHERPDAPIEGGEEGFGTQFLKTIVSRQLKGDFSRTITTDGITAQIHWMMEKSKA